MNQRYPYKPYIKFSFIFLLGFALRLYNLGGLSFWFDEAVTVCWTKNLNNLFKLDECTPPLYFLLVYVWGILGQTEFILRLSSVIFGLCSIIGIYFLTKLFFDTKSALISSFILAISPLHIFYSQELTVYSFFAFLVLLSVYFLKKALEDGRWGFWIGYALFSALSILTHYIAILILFSELIFFMFTWERYKHLSNKWIQSHFLILAFLSPCLLFIIQQIIFGIKVHIGWWIPLLSLKTIGITFKNFSIGYNATPKIFFVASAVYFFLFARGICFVNKKRDPVLLLFFTFIPILCALVLLKFKVKVYVDRYFLPSSLFYYLIIAKGLSMFKNKYFLLSIMIIITILNSLALRNYYLNYLPNSFHHHLGVQEKPDFRSAAYYIAKNFQKDDVIIHTNENSIFSLEYYLNSQYCYDLKHFHYFSGEVRKRLWAKFQNDLDSIKVARYNFGDQLPCNQAFFRDKGVSLEQYSRVWVVVHQFEGIKEGLSILGWMDRHYKRVDEKEFYGLKISLYNKAK